MPLSPHAGPSPSSGSRGISWGILSSKDWFIAIESNASAWATAFDSDSAASDSDSAASDSTTIFSSLPQEGILQSPSSRKEAFSDAGDSGGNSGWDPSTDGESASRWNPSIDGGSASSWHPSIDGARAAAEPELERVLTSSSPLSPLTHASLPPAGPLPSPDDAWAAVDPVLGRLLTSSSPPSPLIHASLPPAGPLPPPSMTIGRFWTLSRASSPLSIPPAANFGLCMHTYTATGIFFLCMSSACKERRVFISVTPAWIMDCSQRMTFSCLIPAWIRELRNGANHPQSSWEIDWIKEASRPYAIRVSAEISWTNVTSKFSSLKNSSLSKKDKKRSAFSELSFCCTLRRISPAVYPRPSSALLNLSGFDKPLESPY